eukprot:11193441-Lingulodinium_polyedra.AAC.1
MFVPRIAGLHREFPGRNERTFWIQATTKRAFTNAKEPPGNSNDIVIESRCRPCLSELITA